MKIKKLINIIKDAIKIYKDSKKQKFNLKVGMCFYDLSNKKCYITHILKDEPKVQIVFKSYFKDIKQTIYFIEDLKWISDYIEMGDYKLCKR